MTTLFISDLHLHPSRPAITALFLKFLREEAAQAEALYILGDLFEAWLGDDDDNELTRSVKSGLRELNAAGVPVYVMRGNRDFLLGQEFCTDTSVQLLADPCVISLNSQPTLLMHGDLLCSDDLPYLEFRQKVRDPAWQEAFLAQPLEARRDFAQKARSASQTRQTDLREDGSLDAITDVNLATVEKTMAHFGVTRLFHGHTHRPTIHSLRVAGHSAQRMVLGDWYEQGSVLRVTADGIELSAIQ